MRASHPERGPHVRIDQDAIVDRTRFGAPAFGDYDMPGLRTVDGIADLGGERGAWFKDPEGNILAVAEYRAG